MHNILVIQLARMGDVLQTTPLLVNLKRTWPDCKISILVDSLTHDLALQCGAVDEVIAVDMRLLASAAQEGTRAPLFYQRMKEQFDRLNALNFDCIYNLNLSEFAVLLSTVPRSAQVAGYFMGSRPRQMGMQTVFAFLNATIRHPPLAPFNLVDYFCMLQGAPANEQGLQFNVAQTDKVWSHNMLDQQKITDSDIIVAFQTATRHEQRQWPIESFARLASIILKHPRIHVVLLGTAEERLQASLVIKKIAYAGSPFSERIHDCTGKTSIGQLAGILSCADLLISGDTGTMHLATAVGCRVLALFLGPAYAYYTGPYGPGHWIIQAKMPCVPCIEDHPTCRERDCMHAIKPEIAASVAEHILGMADLPPCAGADFEILKTRHERWGVYYDPVHRRNIDRRALKNLCYREMAKTTVEPRQQTAWPDIEPVLSSYGQDEHALLYDEITSLASQATWLESSVYQNTYALWQARFSQDFSFWHPWIDCYRMQNEIPDAGINPKNIFVWGLRNATKTLNLIKNNAA